MPISTDFAEFHAISQLKAAYCRLLDTKQWDAWAELFTDDYEIDVSDGTGIAPTRGRVSNIASVRSAIENAKTAHQVHSPEIKIEGDEAWGVWAMQDRLHFENGTTLTGYGQYHEHYVKRNGKWLIEALRLSRFILEPGKLGS
jgi:3-phenylpropionate/cinnamic acid dioxygenase small subunit